MYKGNEIDEGESENCAFVNVWILGWPYVFIVSKTAIYSGDKLVIKSRIKLGRYEEEYGSSPCYEGFSCT
jgi:hypothetical protein